MNATLGVTQESAMDSVPQSVRTVKTPRVPRPDEEEDCAADLAVFASAKDRRPVNLRTGVDSYLISLELARWIASRRI